MGKVSVDVPAGTVNALDAWYARKFERRCPPDKKQALTSSAEIPGDVGEVSGIVAKMFAAPETYFTDSYDVLFRLCSQANSPGEDFATSFRGSFSTVLNALLQMRRFISAVREREADVLPGAVSDSDIDRVFHQEFKGHEGFTNLCTMVAEAGKDYFETLEIRGRGNTGYYAGQKERFAAYAQHIPGCNKVIFGDIQ